MRIDGSDASTDCPSGQPLAVCRRLDEDPENFVRQHYLDFLHRRGGRFRPRFWANEIAACGSDAPCVERKRVDVCRPRLPLEEFSADRFLAYRLGLLSSKSFRVTQILWRHAGDGGAGSWSAGRLAGAARIEPRAFANEVGCARPFKAIFASKTNADTSTRCSQTWARSPRVPRRATSSTSTPTARLAPKCSARSPSCVLQRKRRRIARCPNAYFGI